jgi:hypothetical protein
MQQRAIATEVLLQSRYNLNTTCYNPGISSCKGLRSRCRAHHRVIVDAGRRAVVISLNTIDIAGYRSLLGGLMDSLQHVTVMVSKTC